MTSPRQSDPSKNLNQFNKFLQNNVDFLKQKYTQHFIQQFPFQQLQTKQKIQTGIKFIYDVFSFQKYENDQKMNSTLKKSLRQNILNFIKTNGNLQNKKFTPEDGIKLLKFCIENNQMFAVHYDKKQKKNQEEKSPQSSDNKIEQNQQNQIERQQQQQILTQNQQQIKNNPYLSSKSKKSIKQQEKVNIQKDNEFTAQKKTQAQKAHNQLLKKQAKIIFEFYCKQLNSGGSNTSFQKISHQSNSMTLGKFMAFANISGILYTIKVQAYKPKNQKVLDKKTINQIFRKISKAQKQINFQQFFEVIKELNQIDNTVYGKLNMNKDQAHNKIVRKLKYLNTPFSMKGPNAKNVEINVDQKPYVPITTGHSGKFTHSLKQDIEDRRQKLRLLPHQPYPNPNPIKISHLDSDTYANLNQSMLKQSKVLESEIYESHLRKANNHFLSQRKNISKTTMNQKTQVAKIRLQNSKISFENGQKLLNDNQLGVLQNLIVQDDQNDDQFLKDYKIPKLKSNIGLRKNNNHTSLFNSSRQNQEGQVIRQSGHHLFLGQKTQRKNVVDQLKLRIKQVQKSQRKQLTSLQNKRKSISNYKTSNRYG